MDLKILTWNVEHFSGTKTAAKAGRVDRVIAELEAQDPDVFGLLEVEGAESFNLIAQRMTDYTFMLTEGRQVQEILIGFKKTLRAFITQKGQFKENNLDLRPAALLTITSDSGKHLPILFGHFKSGSDPKGWGLRVSMFEKVSSLKKVINKIAVAQGEASGGMVVLGDLNTMGMILTDSDGDLDADAEILRLNKRFARVALRPLLKSHPHTFSNGTGSSYPDSDLDHVYVDESMSIETDANGHEANVGGWALLQQGAERDAWIASMSDHAPVSFTVLNF
ncbi:endonuclease/exonuclease/phosphatase family protein [Octadecabacter sp. 1_MG-2023]|uniref:endonuclease/exonuclease/phosphatase family protein n=1 Tax=unclassified Octadecabacter TaxID=196158 RepID=UPI001C091CEB|nr:MULTISPECIES: endonuclease/exonuclease/phosphatase family protein [unclassified Octadecabacter]MBU2993323.1 endonuclease/exonuclease/phosphatase family protein [Octadecabacter sp. B2R22]MDO6733221.1 endonuclease/exonuclease/phosphatase family protein [Octadecabacter sp. 1_MG-2023]